MPARQAEGTPANAILQLRVFWLRKLKFRVAIASHETELTCAPGSAQN